MMEGMEIFLHYLEYAARGIEGIGVLIMVIGILVCLVKYVINRWTTMDYSYAQLRIELGKVILLGLEILVAADIIATISTKPTLDKVLTLGLIVLIRTFLSFSLEMEIHGKLPWQRGLDEES